jgi:hypothetical protein
MCLCVMCLRGMRFIFGLCVMCYVLEHITRQHITHNPKLLYIKIQFLLVVLVLRTTATTKHHAITILNSCFISLYAHTLSRKQAS